MNIDRRAPAGWASKPLKFLASHIGSGKTPSGGAEVYEDSGVLFIRSQNIHNDGLRLDDVAYISEGIDEDMAPSRVKPQDVLLNITGASIGRCCLAPASIGPANVNQHVCIIRPIDRAISPWLAAVVVSQFGQSQIEVAQTGAGREGLNFEQIGNMLAFIPPADLLGALLRRIDAETARIDALIERKNRFIELLREKRQALITTAVTKGLNASVAMRQSAVEWLGLVPSHWEVVPLKYLVAFRSGGTPSKDERSYWDGDVPWASAKDLKVEVLTDTEDHLTANALEVGVASLVPIGSVLVVVRGMILARAFPVALTAAPIAINQDLKALLPRERLDAGFLACLLRGTASVSLSRLEEAAHGTKALRMESWTDLQLPVPPITEQLEIVRVLRRDLSALDRIAEQTLRSVDLLRERRSSLITAAVTGQIDLRAEQQTDTALEPA